MEQLGAFLPLILIFGVFYILLIRPQQKKVKMHREMLNNLKKGDKIITSGGIIGKITKVSETRELNVEISDEVEVKVSPGMVTDLYSPPTTKVNQETKTENKPGLLSGFFGNKK
tara:strand:+ start:4365 stop:4706 length:342 start_codon:yes stop_codon:yes gene_type:complete